MECAFVWIRVVDIEKGKHHKIGDCRDVALEKNGEGKLV